MSRSHRGPADQAVQDKKRLQAWKGAPKWYPPRLCIHGPQEGLTHTMAHTWPGGVAFPMKTWPLYLELQPPLRNREQLVLSTGVLGSHSFSESKHAQDETQLPAENSEQKECSEA